MEISNPELACGEFKKNISRAEHPRLASEDDILSMRSSVQRSPPKEKGAHKALLFPLVEMMGIEPMSENPLIKPSPWAVCYLEFPVKSANRHAPYPGSPFVLDRLKSEPPMQVHRSFDAQSSVAVLRGGTGDPQVTAPPIGIPYGMSIRQP